MAGLQVEHYGFDGTLTIRVQSLSATCWACGADASGLNLGIPVYEDLILPNDWNGDWGGVPACAECFEKQNRLIDPMTQRQFNPLS